ncbi:MAG: hypothetical protein ACJ8AK_06330 [Gemmatimonadaceae bacterium]
MVIGIVGLRVSGVWRYPGFTRLSSEDSFAFERAAYQYLAWFVCLALLVLGAVIALWPPRIRKRFNDLSRRPPNNEL